MPVIDFHSHILPEIDDGSKDLETSLEMLRMSAAQGVTDMVATPHFYASKEGFETYLEKRIHAFETLCASRTPDMPRIHLGAEVAFFKGISQAEKIEELAEQTGRILLLEMPFMEWTDRDIQEVERMASCGRYTLMLAHLERYMGMSENKKKLKQLLEFPAVVQINAESLLDWKKRGKLIRMFRKGQAEVLGSDCHGIHHRQPNLANGREVLEKKLGREFLEQMDAQGSRLLRIEGE